LRHNPAADVGATRSPHLGHVVGKDTIFNAYRQLFGG